MIKEYRTNNNSSKLPILGFGTMRLPTNNGTINKDAATKLINTAIDEGVTLLDTAYLYHNGESETFLGEIITSEKRKKVQLSTKLPVWMVKKEEDLDKYLDKQLEKLQTDYIDYYFLHSMNKDVFQELKKFHLIEFLDRIKKTGKVKYVGFSFHDDYETFKEIIDYYPWDATIIQYNYLDDTIQAGTKGLKYAYNKDINIFIMEPQKGGLIIKNIPSEVQNILNKQESFTTPSNWAIKWVMSHPEVTCVLSGMGNTNELYENIQTANNTKPNSLTESELTAYKEIKETYTNLIKIPCSHCNYCKPCPVNVNIPECFEIYNNKYIFNLKNNIRTYIFKTSGVIGGKPSYAGLCIKCGKCIKSCPQKINIPEKLELVKKDMEPRGFKQLVSIINKLGTPIINLSSNLHQLRQKRK
ncbi:MAG: aldo/keto reductase [Methanobacteriaceae archaeon]|nr:aldo/keto reductase [Methanobacteriaceae archaeon]